MGKDNLGVRGRVHLVYLPGDSPSLRQIGAGIEAGTISDCCLLFCSLVLNIFSIPPHEYLPGSGPAHCGLCHQSVIKTILHRPSHRPICSGQSPSWDSFQWLWTVSSWQLELTRTHNVSFSKTCRGQRGGSVNKELATKQWWSEFYPSNPRVRRRKLTSIMLYTFTQYSHNPVCIYTHTN